MDICLDEKARHFSVHVKDLDCFKLEAAGIENCTLNRDRVKCSRCREYLRKACNINSTTPCKMQRAAKDERYNGQANDGPKQDQDPDDSFVFKRFGYITLRTRNKRDDADGRRNVKTEQDQTSSHKTMKTKEEGKIGSETRLESAFFSLSNAIQASETKELEGTDTTIAVESVVQIVECIIAAITLAGSLALMYKMRKRFN